MSKIKKEKIVRLYWQEWVSIFFDFCKENFDEPPSYDGSAPRDMAMIYDAIRKKSEEKKIEWTQDVSTRSWQIFLKFSNQDKWLHENFLLFNLNRQKDRIFYKIKSLQNGNSKEGFTRESVNKELERRNYSGE